MLNPTGRPSRKSFIPTAATKKPLRSGEDSVATRAHGGSMNEKRLKNSETCPDQLPPTHQAKLNQQQQQAALQSNAKFPLALGARRNISKKATGDIYDRSKQHSAGLRKSISNE